MYQIISDGSCDLSQDLIEKYNLKVVPFYITIEGQEPQKENIDIQVEDFYQFMIDNKNVFPKTSLPSINDYIEVFEPLVKEGIDIICICITTKFSGSYNSASTAKQILEEDYPDANICVIDSTINTVLQGLYVVEACKMKEAGYSYQETIDRLEEMKSTGRIFFTVGSFDYLINGGRIGKVAGVAAKTLGIKPLIVLQDGEISAIGVKRGKKATKKELIIKVLDYFIRNFKHPDDYVFCVGYGYDREEALTFLYELQSALKGVFLGFDEPILLQHIGATIGVHTGPEPIGVAFVEKYKVE